MDYNDLPKNKQEELDKLLTEDILERYDNPEYYDIKIIEEFIHDYEIKQKKLEQILDEMENHISGENSLLIFANRIRQIIK